MNKPTTNAIGLPGHTAGPQPPVMMGGNVVPVGMHSIAVPFDRVKHLLSDKPLTRPNLHRK